MFSKKHLRLNITLKQETIHGRTYRNKIKRPCWRQLPISKSLFPQGRRDNNRIIQIFIIKPFGKKSKVIY